MKEKQVTKEEVLAMSYTDFVGIINQWNVLPGAYVTLSKWKMYGHVNEHSRILELACTSGFSSRELALLSGCSAVGIDISKPSVEMAQFNKERYAPHTAVDYIHADGMSYEPEANFSHVVVGAALKFFPDQQKIIERIISTYLSDGGLLLASPFYITKDVPENLVEKAKKVFGITITTEGYHEVMRNYRGFEVLYEDRCAIFQETDDELKHYCDSTIARACAIRNVTDLETKKAMYDRLMEIKNMSNDLRPYQMYTVLVLRYRSDIYPNRYIELF